MRSLPELSSILSNLDRPLLALPDDGRMHLFFSGTRTAKDLLVDDLDVRTMRWPSPDVGGPVHRGFARRTRALLHQLQLHHSQPELQGCNSTVLFGHSMGGACAVLAAARLGRERVEGVYTFGMPRMATRSFCTHYEEVGLGEITTHFATSRDPIVHRIPKVFRTPGEYVPVPCEEEDVWKHHEIQTYLALLKEEDLALPTEVTPPRRRFCTTRPRWSSRR